MKSLKVLLTVAVAALAMSALVASSASAEIVPAKFSSTSIKLTTSGITLKRNGIEAKTCTSSLALSGFTESSTFYAGNSGGFAESKFNCGGTSSFTMVFFGEAQYDTVANRYILHVSDFPEWSLWSPWSEGYWQKSGNEGSEATWVNGSGATASTVTFSNQTVGWTFSGKKVTIEGTFKATNSAGGLLTLSH